MSELAQTTHEYGRKIADVASRASDYVGEKVSVVGDKIKELIQIVTPRTFARWINGETGRKAPAKKGPASSPPTPVLVHVCSSQLAHKLAVGGGSSAASEKRASRALPFANVVNCGPTLLG